MVRLKVEVSRDLKALAFNELLALTELANGSLDLIDDSDDLVVDYRGDINALLKRICRAALIKSIRVIRDINEEEVVRLDRSRYRSLKRGRESGSVSIDLRIARLLVNLARTEENSVFLDPFVGTGIIANEAAMIGARVIGVDINYNALRIARSAYTDVVNADVRLISIRDNAVDSIATDPPYNRLSISDADLDALYRVFAYEAFRVLRHGGYIAFSHPTYVNALDWFLNLGFELVGNGLQYVHGGLTRLIYVFRKP